MQRAKEVNLKFNLRKAEVKFMGHVISSSGLKPDPEKIRAVVHMPKTTCKQEVVLLSLVGFVNYLAKFLPRFSEVTKPLQDLATKHTRFTWSNQHDKAFAELKELVTKHPVLRYYDTT